VAEFGENAADLAIAGFAQRDLDDGGLGAAVDDGRVGGGRFALGEPDAVAHAVEGGIVHAAGDLGAVGLGDAEARMTEALGQLAVVRQQEQAGGVGVEASDGKDAFGHAAKKIDRELAAGRIGGGAEDVLGLMQHEVDFFFGMDGLAVDGDAIGLGIDQDREVSGDGSVDGDAALNDELLAGATGAKARGGKNLLDAFDRHALIIRGPARDRELSVPA